MEGGSRWVPQPVRLGNFQAEPHRNVAERSEVDILLFSSLHQMGASSSLSALLSGWSELADKIVSISHKTLAVLP